MYGADESFDAWIIWRRSNYVVLPFSGGWLEQPWWIRKDFLMLDIFRQHHDIQADKPSSDHLTDPYEEFALEDD